MSEQTKEQLIDYITTTITHKVECGFCAKADVTEQDEEIEGTISVNDTAQDLLDRGWREIDSEEYGAQMIACPSCAEEQLKGPKGKLTER